MILTANFHRTKDLLDLPKFQPYLVDNAKELIKLHKKLHFENWELKDELFCLYFGIFLMPQR